MQPWFGGFVVGGLSSLLWLALPSLLWGGMFIGAGVLCLVYFRKTLLSGILTGVAWYIFVGHFSSFWQLPLSAVNQSVWVQGQVLSLMDNHQDARFNLQLQQFEQQAFVFNPPIIRLSWKQVPVSLKQGQQLSLFVKLKPAHGLANEAGFSYQQWLFTQGIVATGFVVEHQHNRIEQFSLSWRQQLADRFFALELPNQRWLAALGFGYRGLLEAEDWQLVQRTGIAHLIAISGLHLGIVSALSYFLLANILARVSRQAVNVHRIAILMSVGVAWSYSALAGFSLPTVRAWIMLTIVAILLWRWRRWSMLNIIIICVTVIMLLMPLSIFTASFWLSFSAVLIICWIFWRWPVNYVFGRVARMKQALWVMFRVQLALSIFMLPLVAWQFSMVSFISPVVNFIAVPLVTLLVVPLTLLGLLLMVLVPKVGAWVLTQIDGFTGVSIAALQRLSEWSFSAISVAAFPLWAWLLLVCGVLIYSLPNLGRVRRWAWVLGLPIVSYGFTSQQPKWQIDVLDVGQGLALVMQAGSQVVIYDVGPAYDSGFNMADTVIAPILTRRGVKEVQLLFISHSDLDHAGSLDPLLKLTKVKQILTHQDQCLAGWQQQWQGLTLQVLWPTPAVALSASSQNNKSCVLKVSDGKFAALFTGDIDASVEQQLVSLYGQQLQADILIAPHHGSKTSSSDVFVQQVAPRYVVFSQGFYNRWGFPHTSVQHRYKTHHVKTYSTSDQGQIRFVMDDKQIIVFTHRSDLYPFWYANSR